MRTNTAENADAKFPGEAEFFPGGGFIGGWVVAFEVDAMWNDDIGFLFKIGSGGRASGDNAVHLSHEPAGEARVITLRGRSEDDLKIGSEFSGGQGLNHFIITSSVEDTGLVFELTQFAKRNDGNVLGQMMLSKDGDRDFFADFGEGLQHCRGHAGEA